MYGRKIRVQNQLNKLCSLLKLVCIVVSKVMPINLGSMIIEVLHLV